MIRHFTFALLLVFVSSCAHHHQPAPSLHDQLDQFIEKNVQDKKIVGAVILVARNGNLIYQKAAGLSDRENMKPMTEDAVFRMASLTKPVVSLTALRLIDQGVLSLNDPVTKWIPWFKPKLKNGKTPEITIQHLLTHTSGLSYNFMEDAKGPYHKNKVSDGLADVKLTLDQNLRRLMKVPLLFEPGTQWNYSLSTDVLGRVIEKATKKTLGEAVRELVTEPLKMVDTEFVASHPDRLTAAYADGTPEPILMKDGYLNKFLKSAVEFVPSRALNKNAYPSGGGGMVGTAHDYLKLLNTLKVAGAPLLKPEIGRLISTNLIGDIPVTTRGPGWGWGATSALVVNPAKAQSPMSEGTLQWGGAYGHNWFVDTKKDLIVIIMTNTSFAGNTGPFPNGIRDIVYSSVK